MKKYLIYILFGVVGCTSTDTTPSTMLYMPCECSTEYAVHNTHTHVDSYHIHSKLEGENELEVHCICRQDLHTH